MAGGIDRIFGFDLGRKSMPKKDDAMTDHRRVFCSLCGHFTPFRRMTRRERMSPTWKKAYGGYKNSPRLTRY